MQNLLATSTTEEVTTTPACETTTPPVAPAEESLLLNEALILYDQGVNVFLADRATQRAIGRFSEYDPIADREQLADMCRENPNANLEIVLDVEQNLIALGVGIGDWKEKGDDSFNTMSEQNGLPDVSGNVKMTHLGN